jgi:integrase/recombinase XerD
MRYQYKREPLTQDEANRLANACQIHEEKLVIWTLLDTGLRVAELANLTKTRLWPIRLLTEGQ